MSNNNSSQANLVKCSATVASGTLASRFLGFLRDMVIAHSLGTGFWADAFFVAQRIPNLLRDLVGEGAANSAIVPVLSRYHHEEGQQAWLKLIHVVMAWAVIILGVMTIVGILAAPLIVRLMAPGFVSVSAQLELTVALTRIMFPYLILIALTAIQVGILYTLRSYAVPAFSPCLLNIAMILAAWFCASFHWPLAYGLAIAVIIGGVWQCGVQYWQLRRLGVSMAWPKELDHPGARQIGRLMIPRLWGSAVYQLNVFIDTVCASWVSIVGTGGISAIYYANRLIQFPLGVFGYALSSVSLGSLSTLAAEANWKQFKSLVLLVLSNLSVVLWPLMVLMALTHEILVIAVFKRGAFDLASVQITSQALLFLILGLPFFGLTRILVTAFYALQDTKTPVKIATVCLIVNLIGNIVLMGPMKIAGISLASSLSSMLNVLLLLAALKPRLGSLTVELSDNLKKLAWPLLIMLVLTKVLMFLSWSSVWLELIIVYAVGLSIYILCGYIFKTSEIISLVSSLLRRRG